MKKIKLAGVTLAAALLLVGLGACSKTETTEGEIFSDDVTETTTEFSDGTEVVEDDSSLQDDGYFKEIVTGDKNPKITFEAEYNTSWSDDSWDGMDLSIDKVKVVEVDKYVDEDNNTYNGLLSMHYTLDNNGDEVEVHPGDATLILEDGTELEATVFADYWEDVFAANKQKDGYVHFKFDEVDQIDQIQEIKLTFDGHRKGDESDKVDHTYDVSLPLTLQN